MKKLFTIAMMMTALFAKAQVVLEHSYSTNWPMEVVNIEGDGYKYLGIDTMTKAIKIYNTDHSLWKTINTSIPPNAIIYTANSYASKYLFNADNKIEIMVLYATTPNYVFSAILYNEDGTIINTFNNTVAYRIAEVNGFWKLLTQVSANPGHTDVYTLPGQWTGISIFGKPTIQSEIYPNPIENSATINYSLPFGINQGALNVYNAAGQLVRAYTVTNQFTNITINKGDLPSGIYVYDIVTQNGKQAGQRFIVQ